MIHRLSRICLAVLCVALCAHRTRAQMWYLTFEPVFDADELQHAIDTLELTATDTAVLIQVFYDELLAAYADAQRAFRAEMDRIREDSAAGRVRANIPNTEIVDRNLRINELYFDWTDRHLELEDRFYQTVQSTLPDDRVETWQRLVRDRRRAVFFGNEQTWNQATVRRETFDLVPIVDAVGEHVDDAAALGELVEAYAEEVGRAIEGFYTRGTQAYRGFSNLATRKISGPLDPGDEARLVELSTQYSDLRDAPFEVNRRFIDRFTNALSGAARERFQTLIRRRLLPVVFRPEPITIAIDAILDSDVATPEVTRELQVIRDRFATEYQRLSDVIAMAIERFETPEVQQELRARFEQWYTTATEQERAAGYRWEFPYATPWQARDALVLREMKHIRALFDDREVEQLPLAARMAIEMLLGD